LSDACSVSRVRVSQGMVAVLPAEAKVRNWAVTIFHEAKTVTARLPVVCSQILRVLLELEWNLLGRFAWLSRRRHSLGLPFNNAIFTP
jgi:hypothetical protein